MTVTKNPAAQRFVIGGDVLCHEGVCGTLALVVVDPTAGRLAHLIVVPKRGDESRLVPVDLARATDEGVVLQCTRAEFEALEPAVETHFVQAEDARDPRWGTWGYRHDEIVAWPMFGLGPTGAALSLATTPGPPMPRISIEDRVPVGEVRIRRGERVHAEDGAIGKVRGLVVDRSGGGCAVTHVLLDEGHLWGHKQVAIPIGAVTGITPEGVTVGLLRRQIKDLPAVDLPGPHGHRG
jgi:hypothetical protein